MLITFFSSGFLKILQIKSLLVCSVTMTGDEYVSMLDHNTLLVLAKYVCKVSVIVWSDL